MMVHCRDVRLRDAAICSPPMMYAPFNLGHRFEYANPHPVVGPLAGRCGPARDGRGALRGPMPLVAFPSLLFCGFAMALTLTAIRAALSLVSLALLRLL